MRWVGFDGDARNAGYIAKLARVWKDGTSVNAPRTIAVAIAVALHQALNAFLAVARARHGADLQLHQTLGRKTDHLAQQIRIRGLLHERAQVHHLVGHRWLLESGWCRNQTLPTNHRWPPRSRPPATALWGRACGRLRYRRATPRIGTRPFYSTQPTGMPCGALDFQRVSLRNGAPSRAVDLKWKCSSSSAA